MNIAEVASKREGFKEQNSIIMSKKSNSKSKEFLYANSISKRSNRKINVIEVKPNATKRVIDPPKKGKRNPTSLDVLTDFLESTSVHGLQYFGKTDIEVGTFGKILWSVTIFSCFIGILIWWCVKMILRIKHVSRFRFEFNGCAISTSLQWKSDQYVHTDFRRTDIQSSFPCCNHLSDYANSYAKASSHFGERDIAWEREQRICVKHIEVCIQIGKKYYKRKILMRWKLREIWHRYGHIITHPYTSKEFEEIDKLKAFLNANKWKVVEFVKILINCEDIFESCQWNTEQIDCGKSIKTSYSSYGLCCSFNYLLEGYMGPQRQVFRQYFNRSIKIVLFPCTYISFLSMM